MFAGSSARARSAANKDLERARELLADAQPREPRRSFEIDLERQVRLYATMSATFRGLGTTVNSAGRALCLQGKVEDAYALYEKACDLDPLLNVSAAFWNNLGWFAALQDPETSRKFDFAADLALALEPANMDYRETRGLARALRGDREGAIKDFEAYHRSSPSYKRRRDRRSWIDQLRQGRPVEEIFTPAVLQRLRKESS
jgi:tetratricopeptide (TPR) repeat protein